MDKATGRLTVFFEDPFRKSVKVATVILPDDGCCF